MTSWIRFEHEGTVAFGTLSGSTIAVHSGNISEQPQATGEQLDLSAVKVLTPCVPGKMICLWNNFAANAKKQGLSMPPEPLWFLKASTAFLNPGETIERPSSYKGKIVYEGESALSSARNVRIFPRRRPQASSSALPASTT